MPKVAILRTYLDNEVDDTIQPSVAWDLFNDALRDLSKISRVMAKVTIPFTVTDKEKSLISLATNIYEVRSIDVVFADGSRYSLAQLSASHGLRLIENQTIEWDTVFSQAGNFVVRYYRFLTLITDDESVPEIPDIFHPALHHYAAWQYQESDDELELANEAKKKYFKIYADLDDHTKNRGVTGSPAIGNPKPPWAR